jgi:hypothetical protein
LSAGDAAATALQNPAANLGNLNNLPQPAAAIQLANDPFQKQMDDFGTAMKALETPQQAPSLAKSIVAGALAGLFKGMAAGPGPGSLGRAGALGFQGAVDMNQQRLANQRVKNEETIRQQTVRSQMMHLNMEHQINVANTRVAGQNDLNAQAKGNADHIEREMEAGNVGHDSNGKPLLEHSSEIKAKLLKGEYLATRDLGVLAGGTIDDPVWAVIRDADKAQVKVKQSDLDYWKDNGVQADPKLLNQEISVRQFQNMQNDAEVHTTGPAAIKVLRSMAGNNQELLNQLPTSFNKSTPKLAIALEQLQQAYPAADNDLKKALTLVSPDSAKVLMDAFGGGDLLNKIYEQHALGLVTANAAAKQNTPQGQAQLEHTKAETEHLEAETNNLKNKPQTEPGTWSLQEDPDGKPVLLNSKTGQVRPANGVEKAGTFLKGGTFLEGTDAQGRQVAGTAEELKNAGVTNAIKMPALTQTQTLAARELTGPDGLFATARNQILALNKAGKLGPIASRYNNFWAGKGLDGDQQAFRGTLNLIATKLMQAHMGNRGSKDALEHFANIVPENSTPTALMQELNNEYQYVTGIAKRPGRP